MSATEGGANPGTLRAFARDQRRGLKTPLDSRPDLRPDLREAWNLFMAMGGEVTAVEFAEQCRLEGIDDLDHQRRLWRRLKVLRGSLAEYRRQHAAPGSK